MRICIVGHGPLTRKYAPFNDWICWGLCFREYQYQELYGKLRGFDVLWECHDREEEEDYISFMVANNVRRPDVEKCKELAGPEGFKSSLAYMIAEAILEEPDEISLYGFDCWAIKKEEYYVQIPNIKFMLGLAVGRGVKVSAPAISELFDETTYGQKHEQFYETTPPKTARGV